MLGSLDRIVQGMLKPINPYAAIIMGLYTASWGTWLIMPHWNVFTSAPIYSKAAEFSPEWAWGSWSAVCGVLIIAAVFLGAKRLLSLALGFGLWHWWTVAGMFWWGDWHNTAGITYTFIAVMLTYMWLNFKINFIRNDEHMPGTKF